jgi:uncharacterized protein YjbI with pentapeptide repeats
MTEECARLLAQLRQAYESGILDENGYRTAVTALGAEPEVEARVDGGGAIAQDHSVAAGAGGAAVGRDVYGDVIVVAELKKQISTLLKRLADLTAVGSLTPEQQYQVALRWAELGGQDSLRDFDLHGVDLRGANLDGADLRSANLRGAVLRSADLKNANLIGADLCGANLSRADLYLADLSEADLQEADLHKSNLLATKLEAADLRKADLSGAILRFARLSDADLSEARLNRADLHEADLRGVNLRGADLSDADLSETRVTLEQLAQARSLEGTTMPDGTVHGQGE